MLNNIKTDKEINSKWTHSLLNHVYHSSVNEWKNKLKNLRIDCSRIWFRLLRISARSKTHWRKGAYDFWRSTVDTIGKLGTYAAWIGKAVWCEYKNGYPLLNQTDWKSRWTTGNEYVAFSNRQQSYDGPKWKFGKKITMYLLGNLHYLV